MQFGQRKTSLDSRLTIVDKYFRGEVAHSMIQHTTRILVANIQEETSEFLNFSNMLRKLREDGVLTWDKEDKTTTPSFSIQYSKDAGAYFVVLNWCENMLNSEIDKATE